MASGVIADQVVAVDVIEVWGFSGVVRVDAIWLPRRFVLVMDEMGGFLFLVRQPIVCCRRCSLLWVKSEA